MKPEIRILGIDDASFDKEQDDVLLIGVFFRGPAWAWTWPWRDGIF